MKDDHAKLSGSYCAITTGLSVCEESVTSFLWSGKTYLGLVLGGDFWRERPSQKEAGPFRDDDFCKIRVETHEAREICMISLVQQQELCLVWVPFLPPPFTVASLGLGWTCTQSELGMGPSYPCGSVFMPKPRYKGFTVSLPVGLTVAFMC